MGSDRAAHLRRLDRSYEPELDLHFIVDDYGTHSHPVVRAWQEKHPRFALHFTPTSSTWLNLVERWFREFTRKRLPRVAFRSVPELVAAIHESIDLHNEDPKPFVWTVSVHANVAKVSRCRASLETAQ